MTKDGPIRGWICVLGGFILCLTFSADFRNEFHINISLPICESKKYSNLHLQLSEYQHLPDLLHALQRIQPRPDVRRFRVPHHHQGGPPGDVDALSGPAVPDDWV